VKFVLRSQDYWFANDKFAHFGLWFFFSVITLRIGWPDWVVAIFWVNLGLFWEYLDGYNVTIFNDPRGFSWRDLVVDCIGIVGALLIWA